MRVAQVTTRYPPHTGGVETHVAEISERLVGRGHDVTVLTADATDGLKATERRNDVLIRRHRGFEPGGAFHIAPGIVRTLRRLDVDVIHAHNYHSLPLLFAALAVGSPRFVVTPHYHGASADSMRDQLLSLYRPFGGWALHRADVAVAVSEWERDRLRRDFGIKATTIPNGLCIDRFGNAEPEQWERPYLLCVGRLEEYKGVQHVIRALPVLEGYDLLVAGSGTYRATLERITMEERVADRVRFLGYVPNDRLPGLYAGASVFLSLSKFEAYGMTVGEALAAGTPSVVRKEGALAEWTRFDGCTGTSIRESDIRDAVVNVQDVTPSSESLPTWSGVTSRLEGLYLGRT